MVVENHTVTSVLMFCTIASPVEHLDGPTLEYELLRRNIERQTRELSYFTANQMDKIAEKLSADDQSAWKHVTRRFADQTRSVHVVCYALPTRLTCLLIEFFSRRFEISPKSTVTRPGVSVNTKVFPN